MTHLTQVCFRYTMIGFAENGKFCLPISRVEQSVVQIWCSQEQEQQISGHQPWSWRAIGSAGFCCHSALNESFRVADYTINSPHQGGDF